jgi:hypothetical protein
MVCFYQPLDGYEAYIATAGCNTLAMIKRLDQADNLVRKEEAT